MRIRPRPTIEFLEDRVTPATITVNSALDDTTGGNNLVTLREAIIAANTDGPTDGGGTGSGKDEIVFAPSLDGSTITLGGTQLPTITGDLTITGPGADLLTVDANMMSRVFETGAGTTVTIAGLTVTGGNAAADGGGILSVGDLTVRNSTVSDNSAGADGGGILSVGDLTVRNSTVSGNSALFNGGIVS